MRNSVIQTPRWLHFVRPAIERLDDIERGLLPIKSKAQFRKDRIAAAATLWNLEAVAEATKYVPREVKDRYTEIPWDKMLDLQVTILDRDLVPDLDLVWDVVKQVLPELRQRLQDMLHEFGGDQDSRRWRSTGKRHPDELIRP